MGHWLCRDSPFLFAVIYRSCCRHLAARILAASQTDKKKGPCWRTNSRRPSMSCRHVRRRRSTLPPEAVPELHTQGSGRGPARRHARAAAARASSRVGVRVRTAANTIFAIHLAVIAAAGATRHIPAPCRKGSNSSASWPPPEGECQCGGNTRHAHHSYEHDWSGRDAHTWGLPTDVCPTTPYLQFE